MIKNKKKYLKFVQELELPVFYQPWWLDIVCEDGIWNVCIYEKKDGLVYGVLPYYVKRYLGKDVILMPPLTPYLGPWLRYNNETKRPKIYSFEKQVITDLLGQLPNTALQMFKLHPCMPNTHPFTWAGYDNSVRQTYILGNIKDHESLWQSMGGDLRNKISKAKKNNVIEVVESFDVFKSFLDNRFSTSQSSNPYPMSVLKKLDQKLFSKGQRVILKSTNSEGISAMTYLIFDNHTAYYIAGTYNPDNTDKNALSFLLYESIVFASDKVNVFDFEGSTIKSIESFFRPFGGKLTPYYRVYKASNIVYKFMAGLRNADFR